jgi:YesN/AraC family two-component response regulator
MKEDISVIVVDDSRLIRDGIASLLSNNRSISIMSTAENGKDLLKQLEIFYPDIVLLDIRMPVMDGEETLKIITKNYPKIKTIMISMCMSSK